MGFRDYYRQFEDIDEGELNRERRARRAAREGAGARAAARPRPVRHRVARPAPLRGRERRDRARPRAGQPLPGPPRRAPCGACWPSATGSSPEQIVLGNGAAELLQAAALALLGRGDELVMPWPSYPLYPLLAAHAGARPVFAATRGAAARRGGRAHPRRGDLQPERPDRRTTCARRRARRAARRAARRTCTCCSTRRSSTSRTSRTLDACLRLVDAFPRLLVVRTFSKIYGPVRAARGLRGGLATPSCSAAVAPGAGRERADPGGGGARAADRRRRDRAPPRAR